MDMYQASGTPISYASCEEWSVNQWSRDSAIRVRGPAGQDLIRIEIINEHTHIGVVGT